MTSALLVLEMTWADGSSGGFSLGSPGVCMSMNLVLLVERLLFQGFELTGVERDALLPLQKMLHLFVEKIDKIARFSSSVSGA